MKSSRLSYFVFMFCIAVSVLYSCDTASTIEDPTKNYFIKHYGGDGNQEGVDAVVAADGSIYLLGNSNELVSTAGKQLYLVKTDADGKLIWEKTFGGKFDDEAKDIELTSDNRIVVLANSNKGSVENDILLMTFTLEGVKLDSALFSLKTIAGAEADDDASSISQTTDGFIISGTTTSVTSKGSGGIVPEDVQDALHIRVNNNLTIYTNWTKTSGTIGSDGATKIYQINPVTYYVFGYTNINVGSTSTSDFDFWVYQLGGTGDPSTNQMYPGDVGTDEKLTSVIISPVQSGEGFLLAGTSFNPSNASNNYNKNVNVFLSLLTYIL